MADSEPPEHPPTAEESSFGERQSGPVALLAQVTRALTALPDDADDAALLASLGQAVVPVLGDAVALFVVGAGADLRLVGVAPPETSIGRQLAAQIGGQASSPDASSTLMTAVAPPGTGGQRDGVLAVGRADPSRAFTADDLAVVEVLGALVVQQRAMRAGIGREAALRQELEAAALAGRELAHSLNNDLTMPVGVVELLLDRSGISADLFEMLQAAAKDLTALEDHVRAFHDQMRAASNRVASLPPGS